MNAPSKGPRDGLTEAQILDVADKEFGFNHGDMAGTIIKLRRHLAKVQHDLDDAVGYRLATAGETKGDQDRDV